LSDAFGYAFTDVTIVNSSINVVPEPTTFVLLGSGLAGLFALRKKVGRK